MKFTIKDRLQLLGTFPSEGKYEELITRKSVVAKVDLTVKEIEKIGLKTIGNQLTWDKEKEKDIEVEFSEGEKAYIKKNLQKLSEEGKLNVDMVELYTLLAV